LHCKNESKIYGGIGFYLQIKGKPVSFGGHEVDTAVNGIKIGAGIKKIDYVLTRFWNSEGFDSLVFVNITLKRFDTVDVYVNY